MKECIIYKIFEFLKEFIVNRSNFGEIFIENGKILFEISYFQIDSTLVEYTFFKK